MQVGVPDGVVNIVFGTGPAAGSALVSHPQVSLVCSMFSLTKSY